MISIYTYEQFHGKDGIGSTRLRVHNLIKNWPQSQLYKYGQNPEVLIFQKVYSTFDFKFALHFEGVKILDICDPDWTATPDFHVIETMNAMDAVVVPTETLREYLQQRTKTPVRVIKDRFDLTEFPAPKVHKGELKKVVWFGYSHNASTLKFAVPSLEQRDLELLIISNEDPAAYRWALSSDYVKKYEWVKYEHPPYKEIQRADVCVFPDSPRPLDRFKSENKTVISELCGVPVVKNAEELDTLKTDEARNQHVNLLYNKLTDEYDCKKSVEEYKELINEIKRVKA